MINLGTNNAAWNRPSADATAELDRMLAKFPSSCVVLVTISEHGDPTPTLTPEDRVYSVPTAQTINASIRARSSRVVEWSDASAADLQGLLLPDRVHPSEDGQRELARLIAEKVGTCNVQGR